MEYNKFLYENLLEEFGRKTIKQKDIDEAILNNLNPKFKLRYYQEEAFQMFQTFFEEDHSFKTFPLSLLFNMATGSGKTLIMAGLVLYLFSKGYSNFIIFVDKTDIIEKTIDNFLNKSSNKYLFNKNIIINNKDVKIKKVENFEGLNPKDINICFTTIHKLHNDLTLEKENSLTLEEFKNKNMVFISDESHHIQTKTKQKRNQNSLIEESNWENTIENVFNINNSNILLEFTATPGFEDNENIYIKYIDKLIYKYDLKNFVKDKYSKNIDIFKIDDFDIKNLMLISILINQYRQDIANKYGINLKPVILFKAAKEIKDSNENQKIFNNLIDNLNVDIIENIKIKYSDNIILKKIFDFYDYETITLSMLVNKLKINFNDENCFNVNEKNIDSKQLSKKDKIYLLNQQNILNNLEDQKNNIRVIFAVNKLNEGWDVLNLFDIVRIPSNLHHKYKKSNEIPAKSTISEAQLIGRGARYYPFVLKDNLDKFRRKFDDNADKDLKILEDLYYYSFNEPNYIVELKKALRNEGFSLSEDVERKHLKLKEEFKETEFYKYGKIFLNERVPEDFSYINNFDSLDNNLKNFFYEIYSGKLEITDGFSENDDPFPKKSKLIKISDIEPHIIKNALSKIDFYTFENLHKYFNINSVDDLITDKHYLKDFSITFHGNKEDLEHLDNRDYFNGIYNLLISIEKEIQKKIVHYRGSIEFKEKNIKEIFYDKELIIPKNDIERLNGCEQIIKYYKWYVFNANYGTSEEKACFNFIESIIERLETKFEEIFFIRNEKHFQIYNFKDGNAFEPDFVLFLKDINDKIYNYQLFIEPKGDHLIEHDFWKEKFLSEIHIAKIKPTIIENEEYIIYGLPFYNKKQEFKFKEDLFNILNLNMR